MKYEIKQLNDTDVVIISNENPSNKDWYWNENTNKVKHYFENRECYPSLIHRYKVIATISPFELKGLPMLEISNQEEDVEKLAEAYTKDGTKHYMEKTNVEQAFIEGYKTAQILYCEDDMKIAIEIALKFNVDTQYDEYDVMHESFKHIYSEEQIIQSLSTQQFPTSVELTEDLQVIKYYYE